MHFNDHAVVALKSRLFCSSQHLKRQLLSIPELKEHHYYDITHSTLLRHCS